MQNRKTLLFFTVLLTLACLYQISFSFITSSVENKAEKKANDTLRILENNPGSLAILSGDTFNLKDPEQKENARIRLEEDYLRKYAHKSVYPLTGKTYQQCKANEMPLGLDLKGGMAVTLEISIPELVFNLSGKSKNPNFEKAFKTALKTYKRSGDDFITVFEREFKKAAGEGNLISIFHLGDKERFKANMKDEDVIRVLRSEATNALDKTEYIISNRINKFGVTEPLIQKQPLTGRLLIELPGVKDKLRVRKVLQSTANLEFWETYEVKDFAPFLDKANEALKKELSITTGTDSVETETTDSTAVAEVTPTDSTTVESTDSLAVAKADSVKKADSIAGADKKKIDPKDRDAFFKEYPLFRYLIMQNFSIIPDDKREGYGTYAKGCRIGVVQIQDTAAFIQLIRNPALEYVWPRDAKFLWGAKTEVINKKETNLLSLYIIKVTSSDGSPALGGNVIVSAYQDYDQVNSSRVVVNMQMNDEGTESWARITRNNIDKAVAVVLDNYVYTAPVVDNEIPNGSSVIHGDFTVEEATDLANILKVGALPTRAQIVDEALVGPTLGSENIRMGLWSFMAAFVLILIYMIIFYNKGGFVANIALLANVFFLVGALASLQATLTLPGIAGIVLTLGMAVDGNVLIYERIKELLRSGHSPKQAIEDGFKGTYATIIDANVTNLLIAIVLAVFGTGPIRGFAVTLIIGIFTSVFTSIFITRLVIDRMYERKRKLNFSFKWSENFLADTKFNFVKSRKLYYIISTLFIVGGMISMAVRSLDYGVEFTGGRSYVVKFEEPAKYTAIQNTLGDLFVEDGRKLTPEVKLIENKYKAKITTNYLINDEDTAVDQRVEDKLRAGLNTFGKYTIEASRKIDPVISSSFKRSAFVSVILSVIIMFLYIMIRFRKWQYGLGTAVALIHDVLFVVGMYSMLHGIMPFTMEVDQAFIAAVLTIMGYSINDTVVVFDRIREYMRMGRKDPQDVLINDALNSTLSRTVNNSITIFVVLFAIFFFGPESIKGFTFTLMVGVVVGTYSSVCVATPILIDFAGRKKNTEKR